MLSAGAAGAFGGLARRRVDQRLSPSSALPPPPPGNVFNLIYIVGPKGLLLAYSPTVGPGNLVFSVAAVAGTDHGNAYLPGATTYTFDSALGVYFAASLAPLSSGQPGLVFFTAPTEAGPWVSQGGITYAGGEITINALAKVLIEASTSLAIEPQTIIGGTSAISAAGLEIQSYLALQDQASAPPAVAGVCTPYANVRGDLAYVSGSDDQSYDVGRRHLWTTATDTVNAVVPTLVPGLSNAVGTGKYHITGKVVYVGNQAGGTPTFTLAGPAVSDGLLTSEYKVLAGVATQPIPAAPVVGGLGNQSGPTLVNGGFVQFTFDFLGSFTAAGTFEVEANTSAAVDTFTIQVDSWVKIEPVSV